MRICDEVYLHWDQTGTSVELSKGRRRRGKKKEKWKEKGNKSNV